MRETPDADMVGVLHAPSVPKGRDEATQALPASAETSPSGSYPTGRRRWGVSSRGIEAPSGEIGHDAAVIEWRIGRSPAAVRVVWKGTEEAPNRWWIRRELTEDGSFYVEDNYRQALEVAHKFARLLADADMKRRRLNEARTAVEKFVKSRLNGPADLSTDGGEA